MSSAEGRAPHDPAPWRSSPPAGAPPAACLSGRQQLWQLRAGALICVAWTAPARRSRRPTRWKAGRARWQVAESRQRACRGDGLFEDDPGTARFADRAAGGVQSTGIRRGRKRAASPTSALQHRADDIGEQSSVRLAHAVAAAVRLDGGATASCSCRRRRRRQDRPRPPARSTAVVACSTRVWKPPRAGRATLRSRTDCVKGAFVPRLAEAPEPDGARVGCRPNVLFGPFVAIGCVEA